MSENTNTFITGEVYPYQITDRTLSFIPKLSPAADDHFKELMKEQNFHICRLRMSLLRFIVSQWKPMDRLKDIASHFGFILHAMLHTLIKKPEKHVQGEHHGI